MLSLSDGKRLSVFANNDDVFRRLQWHIRCRQRKEWTQIKRFEQALSVGDAKAASEQYRLVVEKLDKIAGSSTMHKNTAARKKSRLAKKLNSLKTKKA